MLKKTILIASALLIAIAFSGCSKKPRRPNPLDTVMGQGYDSSSRDEGFNPVDLGSDAAAAGLTSRGNTDQWIDRAQRGVLPTVYFSFDSATISPDERGKVNQAAEYLRNNPGSNLVLEGHCDWRGTTEYNLALGDRRAKAVQNYLATLGISESRLQTLSQGDLQATEGASSAQMTQERKVELLVVD
ncbi:OmpA family protein [Pelagicoccus sp. SDUM812003]|uniref:OmpA family protein n=1 Tax=Pelagicoccus sp. SDUM812003 TaxID=3041267 RepID=UPI00280DACFB|nr:OmpA family protein [Pelagicoccus sp. SDUM812003]MDQ8204905.1 OmpA family protein [Pelagicoccus sp. SDUM812003]